MTFLKENRSIILNGRITPQFNNFTFVSPHRGSSVPDYIFCPVDHLEYCKQVKTLLMSEAVNLFNLQPPLNLPDHSILISSFETSYYDLSRCNKTQFSPNLKSIETLIPPKRLPKKNLKKINNSFFMSEDVSEQVNATISKLETEVESQNELDDLWRQVKNLLMNELDTLPDLPTSNNKKQNKTFKKSQQFWNENLELAWKEVCNAEKDYLSYKANVNCQHHIITNLHQTYKNSQKIFDRKFRFFKRKHRKQPFIDLENLSKENPSEMWAKLRKLCNPPSTRAALQIVREDESISSDIREVLKRWHKDISNLFSGLRENPNFAFDDEFYEEMLSKKAEFENISQSEQHEQPSYQNENMNSELSFDEVSSAIDRVKSGKSYLEIPNEAMKNKNAKLLFLRFFNLCFKSGLSPSEWDTSDIKPIPKKDKDSRDPLQNRCITIMCCVAKIYSGILNRRLQNYLEKNNILVDEQNGFRASRSCIDHDFQKLSILWTEACSCLNYRKLAFQDISIMQFVQCIQIPGLELF